MLADLCASGNVPHAVVFYDGINDVFAKLQSPDERRPQMNFEKWARWYSLMNESGLSITPVIGKELYLRNSLAIDLLRSLAENPEREPLRFSRAERVPVSDLAAESVRDYLGTCEVVRALARQYNFRTLFVWQPVLATKRLPSAAEREILQTTRSLDLRFFGKVYGIASKLIDQETGCVDESGVFDDSSSYYFDWAHVSERGNRVIAARLYGEIKPLIVASEPAK